MILAELNLPVSLKCHLPAAARPSLPAAAPPASHQVMWYLDGAYFHSSGAQEVYNFSLADLGQLKGLSSHLGGRLSCAHHLLAPSATSPENFQGSSMKVYHSANSFDFRVQGKFTRSPIRGRHESRRLAANKGHSLGLMIGRVWLTSAICFHQPLPSTLTNTHQSPRTSQLDPDCCSAAI